MCNIQFELTENTRQKPDSDKGSRGCEGVSSALKCADGGARDSIVSARSETKCEVHAVWTQVNLGR